MKKNVVFAIIVICLVVTPLIAFAIPPLIKTLPTTGTTETIAFTVTIDGTPYAAGASLDWGTLSYGDNTANIRVTNTGTTAFTLALNSASLPSGWSLSWNVPASSLAPTDSETGIMTLNVPESAEQGASFTWDTIITATEA